MSSLIEIAQGDIFGRVTQDEFFADIKSYLFRPRTAAEAVQIQTDIDNGLAGLETKGGKSGAAVIVNMPSGNVPDPDIPGPRFDLVYGVRVLENPIVNMGAIGTQKSAEEIVLNVLNVLHHFIIDDFGVGLIADKIAFKSLGTDDQGRIAYDCFIVMRLGLQKKSKVAMPRISGSAAAVTITTLTAGATIIYTTDGTYPAIGTGFTGVAYTVPFSVTSGTSVRSVATKTGLQASDLAAETIT